MPVDEKIIFRVAILLVALCASIYDIVKKEIPIVFLCCSGGLSICYVLAEMFIKKIELLSVLPALIPGAFFLMLFFVSSGSIGAGDGIFLLCISAPFGFWGTFTGALIGLFCSAVFSIVVLVMGRGNRRTKLPFVPFITIGLGVCTYAGI